MSYELRVSLVAICLILCSTAGLAQQTPPVLPKIQETPLPPAVTLPAPANVTADAPNRPLTADEAARIGLRRQPNITIARAGVIAAQGRDVQAKAGLLPTLGTGASYTNVSLAPVASIPGGSVASGYQMTANVRQLVFDFNHTRDIVRQTSAQERSANASLTKVQSDTVLQIKQAFYAYAQNTRLVKVNEANVGNSQSHLALAQARLNAGLGLPADVVRAQTSVADAIFNLNLARNVASVAEVNLALLMGIDPRTPVEFADTDEATVAADDPGALTDEALKRRPEILGAYASLAAAGYSVSAAKTYNAPALSANAGWLQRGSDFPPGNKTLTYGVAMQWTPFDAGLTAGRVEEARANLLAAQAQLESVKLSVISDVSQAYLNLKTAEQRVVTAEAEVANAQEAVRLTEGRYKSGLGTFLDVLDAQTASATAGANRINAQSSVNQARAALAHATGAPFQPGR